MKKTFQLAIEGRHPDRVLDAVKHEIRKYLRRERRRPLPEGVDFLDFDCRFGRTAELAEVAPLAELIGLVDAAARDGAATVYVEMLAKPGQRKARPAATDDNTQVAAGAGAGAGSNGDGGSSGAADAGSDGVGVGDRTASGRDAPTTASAPHDSGLPSTELPALDGGNPR